MELNQLSEGLASPGGAAAPAEPDGGAGGGRQRGRSVRERFGRAHSPRARRAPRGYAARQAAKEMAALWPAGAGEAAAAAGNTSSSSASSSSGGPSRTEAAARAAAPGSTAAAAAAPAGVGYTALRSLARKSRTVPEQQVQHTQKPWHSSPQLQQQQPQGVPASFQLQQQQPQGVPASFQLQQQQQPQGVPAPFQLQQQHPQGVPASFQLLQQQQRHLQAQLQPLRRQQQQRQQQQRMEHVQAQQVSQTPACHGANASSAVQVDDPQTTIAAAAAAAAAAATAATAATTAAAAAAAAAEADELAGTPSSTPLLCRLQQQLTRLKKAHQLISQEVQPETPPGALAASVAVLFDDAPEAEEAPATVQLMGASTEQQQAAASHQAAGADAAAVQTAAAGKQPDTAAAGRTSVRQQPARQAQLEPAVASAAAVSSPAKAAGAAAGGSFTSTQANQAPAPKPACNTPYIFEWLESLEANDGAADEQAAAAEAAGAAAAAAVAAAADADAGEHQFEELMRRLQQLLPALRATGASNADFETSWAVLEAELSALMTAARLSALQAGRLQALDGEVLKLQSLLVLLGKHIKAGAQPQQLSELVNNFPSYGGSTLGSAPTAAAAAPAAIRQAAPAARLQPLSHGRAAAAAVTHQPLSPGRAAAVAAATAAAKALRAAAASAPSHHSTPWVGPNSKPRASTPDRSHSGLCREDSWGRVGSASASPRAMAGPGAGPGSVGWTQLLRSSSAGRYASPPRAPVSPPPKHLTPDESATLMGLYKVRTTPERISYKTMWLPGRTGSPNSLPPHERRTPSPGRGLSGSSVLLSPRQPSGGAALRAHQQHSSGSWEGDSAGRATMQLQTRSGELIHVSAGHQPMSSGYSSSGGGKASQGRRGPGLFSSSSAGAGQRVGAESPRPQWQHTLTVVQAERSLAGGAGGARSRPASAAAAALRSPRGVQGRRDLAVSVDLSRQHLQDRLSAGQLTAYPGRREQSPIGGMRYIARPASAEPQQLQRHRQQQPLRGRNGNTMGLAASWDSSMWRKAPPRAASPSASAGPSPRGGASRFVAGPAWGAGSLNKWGSSGYSAAAVGGGGTSSSAAIACLADEVDFQDACKAFRQHLQAQMAAGSFLRSDKRLSTAARQLAVRLSPNKDADSDQVHTAIKLLAATLQQHGVNLELQRLSPFIYAAGGRKLHVRLLNGNLLVRTGGGYIDLTTALAKMPAATAGAGRAVAAARGGGGSVSSAQEWQQHDVLGRLPSPGRASPRTHASSRPQSPGRADRCYTELLAEQYGGGCRSPTAAAVASGLEAANAAHALAMGAGHLDAEHQGLAVQQRELSLEHLMQDLEDSPSLYFRRAPSPHVAVLRADSSSSAAAGGGGGVSSSSSSSSSAEAIAAMEAAVKAAVDAAVEAAANAGLDDGGRNSGGGAPAASQLDAAAQAALASSAGAGLAGVLFEGGMCPPVPVQDTPVAGAFRPA